MNVTIKLAEEPEYTWQLIRTNMQPYYQQRQLIWDKEGFLNGWMRLVNFEVFGDSERIGVMRFGQRDHVIHLYTLQIEQAWQNKGIGVACLELAVNYARSRGTSKLSLCVFAENPALTLYKRFGFVATGSQDGTIEMILDVSEGDA